MSDSSVDVSIADTRSIRLSQLQCDYGIVEALGFVVLWVILSIITLGIGSFFAIYYFYKSVINKTSVVDSNGNRIARLNCELNLAEVVGHIIIWILLTIITLGIGLIFYAFRTFRMCLNKTNIQYI